MPPLRRRRREGGPDDVAALALVLTAIDPVGAEEPPPEDGAPRYAALPATRYEPTWPATLPATQYVVTGSGTGSNLQTQLNAAAACGTDAVVILAAGVAYRGNFTLPKKTNGTGWAYVTTDAVRDGVLVRPHGQRLQDADFAHLATIETATSNPVFLTETPAAWSEDHQVRQWWLRGLEIAPAAGLTASDAALVSLGYGDVVQNTPAKMPDEMCLTHCRVHGDGAQADLGPGYGMKRGTNVHAKQFYIKDNVYRDLAQGHSDGGAVWLGNASGPGVVENNELLTAGINFFTGGAEMKAGVITADVYIRYNHIAKRPEWNERDPAYAGVPWVNKNLFEIKSGVRFLIEGNVLDYSFADAQKGAGMLVKALTQDGDATADYRTHDITIRRNRVRDCVAPLSFVMNGSEINATNATPCFNIDVYDNEFEVGDTRVLLGFESDGTTPQTVASFGNGCAFVTFSDAVITDSYAARVAATPDLSVYGIGIYRNTFAKKYEAS